MNIKARLLASLLLTLAALAASNFVNLAIGWRSEHYHRAARIANVQFESWLKLNAEIHGYVKESLTATGWDNHDAYADPDAIKDAIAGVVAALNQLEVETQLWETEISTSEEQEETKRVEAIWINLAQIRTEFDAAFKERGGERGAALRRVKNRIERTGKLNETLKLVDQGTEAERHDMNEAEEAVVNFRRIAALGQLGGSILIFLLCWYLLDRIRRSINASIELSRSELVRGTQALGQGNFTTKIDIHSQDELSVVAESFNAMVAQLNDADQRLREQHQLMLTQARIKELGEMAAGIAHEINNPLAILQLNAEIIADNLSGTLNLAQTAAQLETIRKMTARIASIVKGMRMLSRDGSEDPAESTRVDELVRNVAELSKKRFQNAGIRLEVLGADKAVSAECRPTQIGQVLLNLLNNAHDAIQAFEQRWVRVELLEDEREIQIAVTDCGTGISPKSLNRLFQPFFTTKEPGKGTGLGLSISRQIAEKHGGSLVYDEKSSHTRFVIRFPKVAPSPDKQKSA